jgi:hypothetical protein
MNLQNLKIKLKSFGSLSLSQKLLVALALSLPLERIPSLNVFGLTLKISSLLIVYLAIVNLKDLNLKKLQSSISKSSLPVKILITTPALILGYSILSLAWAGNLTFWLKANLSLGLAVVGFYGVIITIKSQTSAVQKQILSLVKKAIILSAVLVMAFGFLQWLADMLGSSPAISGIRPEYTASRLGLTRIHSTLLEPLYFGLYLLLPLGIALTDFRLEILKTNLRRVIFIAAIYIFIILSLSRGAIVASLIVGLISLCINCSSIRLSLTKLRSNSRFKKRLLKLIILAALSLIVLVGTINLLAKKGSDPDHNYPKGISTIIDHFETIKPWGNKKDALDQNSINSRDQARLQAWGIIKKSPSNLILGVGAGQYGNELSQGYGATSNFLLLDIWAEYGLVGLILIFLSFASAFRLVIKNKKEPLSLALGLYLIGFMIQSISFGNFAVLHLWLALGLLVSVDTHLSNPGGTYRN